MSWKQLVPADVNTPAQLGMCLAYVQNAFGSGWAGSYALDGWNRNRLNHPDYNIPSGVFVPIWFDGHWNGIRYGHVAIYKDGVVYSSPWSAASAAVGRHDALGSIADVERIYRMSFIGWSEDIGGARVISPAEEEDVLKPSEAEIIDMFELYLLEKPKTREQIEYYLNQDVRVLYRDVLGATKPKPAEINTAFADLLPGTTDPNRIPYYSTRTAKQLYADIAGSLKRKLADDAKRSEYEELKQSVYIKKK